MAKPVLLVVDDDAGERDELKRLLEQQYGERYDVQAVSSGIEALETLRQLKSSNRPVALILASQDLQDIPVVEFLKQAIELFPEARRVILASYRDADSVIKAINEAGIDHYLVKPCLPAEQNLYPAINDLLKDWETLYRLPFQGVRVVGYRFSPKSFETRDFLVRNSVPFQWIDVERAEEARKLLTTLCDGKVACLPIVIFPDGTHLIQPSNAQIAEKLGLEVRPGRKSYDVVIVGGGPAGLAAGVYAGSEGLRTVMVERDAPGGQAGLSSLIENYLGFPAGLTGVDLARRAVAQARKFDVEIVTPQVVSGLHADGSSRVVTLSDNSELRCEVVLLSMGVQWRRLDVPGVDRLTGAGVYYGGTMAEAFFCRGEEVFIVGGGNSAGQAALQFSRYASKVTMLVRSDSLSKSMSQYLIDRINEIENIEVRLNTTVTEVHGQDRLEAITVFDASTGKTETLRANAMFIFIGAVPHTEWLQGAVEIDQSGYIFTGPEVPTDQTNGNKPRNWSLDRDPFWLETSTPGVFAAGDVRHGSVKRVAAGVGEGATAVLFMHRYLNHV